MPTYDATTLGELMLRFSVPAGARLEAVTQLDVHPGGAESNLIALLARLGRPCAWMGALPAGPLGRLAANALRMAGVDLSGVVWHSEGRMGTYYVEFSVPPRPIQVIYDRADSCAARLTSDQVDWQKLLDTRLLHLTGITPALSAACLEVTRTARRLAREQGVPVSFDVNFRQKLWEPETAAAVLAPLVREIALLFCGHGDAQRLFGCAAEPARALDQLADLSGAATIVMSIGDAGVLALHQGVVYAEAAASAQIIDRLGAGDALAAGVIHGWLDGDLPRGLRTGAILAALALSQAGDIVITTPAEVDTLLAASGPMIVR